MEDFKLKYLRAIICDLDYVSKELNAFSNQLDTKDCNYYSVVPLLNAVNVLQVCASLLEVFLPKLNSHE